MAIPSIKATYTLDVATIRTLEQIARRWNVSKSEALRRAIRTAATGTASRARGPLEALDELQGAVALTSAKARAWAAEVRTERRTVSARSGRRVR